MFDRIRSTVSRGGRRIRDAVAGLILRYGPSPLGAAPSATRRIGRDRGLDLVAIGSRTLLHGGRRPRGVTVTVCTHVPRREARR